MLTACLWEVADVAPTSPDPLWHPDALSAFDASSPLLPDPIDGSVRAGKGIPVKLSRALGNLLSAAAGTCKALCQVALACCAPPVSVCCHVACSGRACGKALNHQKR